MVDWNDDEARRGGTVSKLFASVWDLAAPYLVLLVGDLATRLCFSWCGDRHCDIGAVICLVPMPVAVVVALVLVVVAVFRTLLGHRNPLRLWAMMPMLFIALWAFVWLQEELAG